jgi:hypothetical protein
VDESKVAIVQTWSQKFAKYLDGCQWVFGLEVGGEVEALQAKI